MLAFQTTKRPRDDESDSEDERYMKKSRSWSNFHNGFNTNPSPSKLALRTVFPPSPPQAVPGLSATTSAQSERSEAISPPSPQDDHVHQFSSPVHADVDMDTEMDEDDFDIIGSQPPDSPYGQHFMRPAKLNSELFNHESAINNTGRIPTPIYPNFNAPRGPMSVAGMSGLGYPSSGFAGGMSMGIENRQLSNPILRTPPVAGKQIQADHDRSRRMPSPISEDEDLPDTPTALTQSQLSRLSVTSNSHSAEQVDVEARDYDTDMAPPPEARGRKRSGALSGRGRFSMGYREDCDKCRQRVPGHYSHFLP